MIEAAHRVGSRIRRSPLFERHEELVSTIEPAWQSVFERLTRSRGFVVRVNGDPVRLTYGYASYYDRLEAYEPAFFKAFADRTHEGMTVLDIGSHVGFFAIGAARRVGATGKVYAFEPVPETADLLQRHVDLNGYSDRVEVVRAVVCDEPGTVRFYARGASMAASMSRYNTETLTPERSPEPTIEIELPSTTLDRFCSERDIAPDVVKVDVEGAELRVLRGARELLQRADCALLCEIHPAEMRGCGASLEELHAYLESIDRCLEPLDRPSELGIFHASVSPSSG